VCKEELAQGGQPGARATRGWQAALVDAFRRGVISLCQLWPPLRSTTSLGPVSCSSRGKRVLCPCSCGGQRGAGCSRLARSGECTTLLLPTFSLLHRPRTPLPHPDDTAIPRRKSSCPLHGSTCMQLHRPPVLVLAPPPGAAASTPPRPLLVVPHRLRLRLGRPDVRSSRYLSPLLLNERNHPPFHHPHRRLWIHMEPQPCLASLTHRVASCILYSWVLRLQQHPHPHRL
jgi:hypothetical protein